MWVLEASVAREIRAEGLGKWRGMAEEWEDFAVWKERVISGVQERRPLVDVASVSSFRIPAIPGRNLL
jgi:hypothetical protein